MADDVEQVKTPLELAQERLAEATASLSQAQVDHDTSETAQALAEAKEAHAEAKAAHEELSAFKVEPDKHVLVQFAGTADPVPVDIPDSSYRDELGRCRERRMIVNGVNVEHSSDVAVVVGGVNHIVWVYRQQ